RRRAVHAGPPTPIAKAAVANASAVARSGPVIVTDSTPPVAGACAGRGRARRAHVEQVPHAEPVEADRTLERRQPGEQLPKRVLRRRCVRRRYRRRMGPTVPDIDAGARERLTARFGGDVEAWFDELPGL